MAQLQLGRSGGAERFLFGGPTCLDFLIDDEAEADVLRVKGYVTLL